MAIDHLQIGAGMKKEVLREEVLQAIGEDQLDYIRQPAAVDVDDTRFLPLASTIKDTRHAIGEILEQFRTCEALPKNAFPVRTDGGHVFLLYFRFNGVKGSPEKTFDQRSPQMNSI